MQSKYFINRSETWRNSRAKTYIDIVELLLASISFPIAIWITRTYFIPEMEVKRFEGIIFFAIVLLSWFVLSRITMLARLPRTQRYLTIVFQFARNTFLIFLALVTLKVALRFTSIPILMLVIYVCLLFTLSFTFRILCFRVLKIYRLHGRNAHNVLIVADAFSDGIIEILQRQNEWGFRIQSILTNSKLIKAKYGHYIRVTSDYGKLKSLIDQSVIDEVIYCRHDVDIDLIKNIARLCEEVGVILRMQSSVSPLDPTEFQLKKLSTSKDQSIDDIPSNKLAVLLKSMGDLYFSLISLILLFPLFLVIAILIKLGSKGPIFFTQERIGLRGRKFKLYKFRTMVVNAEDQLTRLKAMNEADGPVFKIKNDPRITRIGRFLRRTGMDELPQLMNVAKGDMSLIGPRPPLESEVKHYERWQLRRLSVKPGITCSWQIVPDRHNVTFEEWMDLDLSYIDNWNLKEDFKLFFKSVRRFFSEMTSLQD
jgi:exopolysaccharide biosynthesis polyprenyl glycosylphosphotransferase